MANDEESQGTEKDKTHGKEGKDKGREKDKKKDKEKKAKKDTGKLRAVVVEGPDMATKDIDKLRAVVVEGPDMSPSPVRHKYYHYSVRGPASASASSASYGD